MSQTISFDPSTETAPEIQVAVEDNLKRIDHLLEKMAKDQVDIDQLRSETQTILDRLKAA